jgi:hypothetical protein
MAFSHFLKAYSFVQKAVIKFLWLLPFEIRLVSLKSAHFKTTNTHFLIEEHSVNKRCADQQKKVRAHPYGFVMCVIFGDGCGTLKINGR